MVAGSHTVGGRGRQAAAFVVAAVATSAALILPLVIHGLRNVPWEILFGFGCYVTGFFRGILGERFEGFLGLILWPLILFPLLWWAAYSSFRLPRLMLAILALFFFGSLFVCVSSETANDLGGKIPLYWNELSVRF
jgi:hypothetical protein